MRRGWRPKAENADALSVKGALDGFEVDFVGESDDEIAILGFEEKREDII